MKVVQIVPGILEKASGPSYSVPALCQSLVDRGVDLELHVNDGRKPEGSQYAFYAHGCWNWPPRLAISPAMHRAAKHAAAKADILHSHGLWNMANIYAGWAVRGNRCLFVASPRGTLNQHARNKFRLRKTAIWRLWQRSVLDSAKCLHATSAAECEAIRNKGLETPIAVIPNGIDIPDLSNVTIKKKSGMRRLLFLSRITPLKGIESLLEAWAAVQSKFHEWELHITGIDDRGHEALMKTLARRLKVERVSFTGPVYGVDKTCVLLEADLFVLASSTENFGMAVAEALAHGVPAIVAKGAPWEGLEAHDCGWWIDIGVEPLIECLKSALAESPKYLVDRGACGRKWMERDFSWAMVGEKMLKTYRWIVEGGCPPDWVRFD